MEVKQRSRSGCAASANGFDKSFYIYRDDLGKL